MLLAISCAGPDLSSPVDARFGRCRYLLVLDSETGGYETIENPHMGAAGGAGIRTAQMVVDKGVRAVLTGNMGPNAWNVLSSAGVEIYTGLTGTAESALAAYRQGSLASAASATAKAHSGMGEAPGMTAGLTPPTQGPGPVQGFGMGGGAGGGPGRGRGRGKGPGNW